MTSPLLLATGDNRRDADLVTRITWAMRMSVAAAISLPEAQNLLTMVIQRQGFVCAERYVEQIESCETATLAAATARLIAAYYAAYRPTPDDDVA